MSAITPLIFSASWCVNCTVLKNNLKESGVVFDEVNVDSDLGREMAIKYGIRSLPTTLFTDKEGVVIKTIIGVKPVSEYM